MRILSIYSTAILLAFAWATSEGYAVNSLFGNHRHERPGEHGAAYYHK
jgi:hypothetical protein